VTAARAAKPSLWRLVLFGPSRGPSPRKRPDGVINNAATRRVLLVLLTGATNLWGYSLCELSGIGLSRVYPVLARLEDAEWIEGRWQEDAPEGQDRRRYYSLTPRGRVQAAKLLGLEIT
jgi:PadR family transcriptional regulator, regulatory protein PadR